MIDDNSIKKHISKHREKCGISQKEMADKLGMDRTTYRSIEKGKTKLINSHIHDIAESLGASTEEIVLGYSPEPETHKVLEEYKASSEEKFRKIIEEYESRLSSKDKEIEAHKAMIKVLSGRIEDKDEMISMLKKRIQSKNQ